MMSEFKYTQEFVLNTGPSQTQIIYDGRVIYSSHYHHIISIIKFCNEVMRPWMESMSMGFHQLMMNQLDEYVASHEKVLGILNDTHGDEVNRLTDEIIDLKSTIVDRDDMITKLENRIDELERDLSIAIRGVR